MTFARHLGPWARSNFDCTVSMYFQSRRDEAESGSHIVYCVCGLWFLSFALIALINTENVTREREMGPKYRLDPWASWKTAPCCRSFICAVTECF